MIISPCEYLIACTQQRLQKEEVERQKIIELAQKLYEDDGHSGNIYKKAPVNLLRIYEFKAQEIIEKEEENGWQNHTQSNNCC